MTSKVKQIFAVLVFTIISVVYFSGCGMEQKDASSLMGIKTISDVDYDKSYYPVKIENQDDRNRDDVQIYNRPPQRVVAVWQNSIETLIALGAGDRIVAAMGLPDKKYLRPEYQDEYDKIPIKSFQNLDIETVMMLQPDMILGWRSTFDQKVLRSTSFWHDHGVNTYIAGSSAYGEGAKPNHTLEEEYNYILDMGKIFNKNQQAQNIVDQMKDEIESAKQKAISENIHPRAVIIEFESKGFRVYGKNSLAGNILENVGGHLLAEDATTLGVEELVNLDPDAIFLVIIESNYGKEQNFIDMIKENKALHNLRCIRENRIYTVPLYAVYTSGIRTYDGIKIIAQGLYPDLYADRK